MSAVRRQSNRSNRAALSSPYSRPVRASSWSLTGILSFLNPLRRRSSRNEEPMTLDEPDIESDSSDQDEENHPILPVRSPLKRGHQSMENVTTNGHALPGPPPPASSSKISSQRQNHPSGSSSKIPSVEFTFKASSSPAKNLDTVSSFLTQHANRPIAAEDISQMVTLIQQSKPEPFRFESRAATSPPRSKSPSAPPRSSSAAPRTLSRNPNGVYSWRGAGSARPRRARNNFASPAFRIPRPTTTRNTENIGNDTKRRKVESPTEESQALPVSNQVPFPVTNTAPTSRSNTSGSSLKPPPVSTPRQRTPGLQKPTTPVVPSPLRQAWTGGSPSGSESGSPQAPGPLKQTETARHVSELVNSLKTQDKVLDDLRNPYELASPVKRPTVPKRKRVAAPAKKPTSTETAPKEEKTKVKAISAHDIIEATLPEGSKRSRPPHFEKVSDKPAPQSKESRKVTIVEEDDKEAPAPKRSKPTINGHAAKEPVDIEMEPFQPAMKEKKDKPAPIKVPVIAIPASQSSAAAKSLFGPKSSQPKEPSKLRYSVQVESTSTPPSPAPAPKFELETLKSVPKPSPTETMENEKKDTVVQANLYFAPVSSAPIPTPPSPPKSAKEIAMSQPLVSLPSFTFTFPPPFMFGNQAALEEAMAIPRASLPTFDLTKSVVPPAPVPATSLGGFDWSAASAKAPVASTNDQWTCDTCMLKNAASATEKCTICDAPKPGAAPKQPAPSFNWGAAGIKSVNGTSAGEWVCSTCSLKNPATATAKCTICDEPKPGAAAPTATASFNWGAAGIKPPTPTGSVEWTCNLCQLKNPASATEKCTICDAPRS